MTYIDRDEYMELLTDSLKRSIRAIGEFKQRGNVFVYTGSNKALNKCDEIPVNYLFGRVWYGIIISWQYVEAPNAKQGALLPFVSIPFFTTMVNDNQKMIPVFRAEWDSYPQQEDVHPQPHWHFSHTRAVYDMLCPEFGELEESWDMVLLDEYSRIMDDMPMNKMHFTISERWEESGDMVSEVPCANKLADWIACLLQHVETEMRYIMNE